MSTVRDVVSRVRSVNKFINGNDLINDRTIANELKSVAVLLIKRETNLRRLWATDTIFQTIPCLAMKKVPITECAIFTSDRMVSRSIEKLPRISEGIYNYLVQGVFGLDLSQDIKYMELTRYINSLKLDLKTNDVYFWITDDFLYVSNPNVKNVRVVAYFEEDIPYNVLYPKKNACGVKSPDCPTNPLDLEFRCPGYLENQVVQMTCEYIRKTYLSTTDIKADENQDTQKRQ